MDMRYRDIYKLVAGVILSASFSAQAQTVSIDIEQSHDFGADWFIGANIRYTDGANAGLPAFGGAGDLLCFNRQRWNPIVGDTHQYEVRTTDYFYKAGGMARGQALVHWLLDNYYHQMVTTDDYGDRSAFHYALWEVAHDYDGTQSSLNLYAGENDFEEPRPDLDYVLGDLLANYSLIDSGYRSSFYTVTYLEDMIGVDPESPSYTYQSMLLVAPIPEPSSMALIGLAGSLVFFFRKRAA